GALWATGLSRLPPRISRASFHAISRVTLAFAAAVRPFCHLETSSESRARIECGSRCGRCGDLIRLSFTIHLDEVRVNPHVVFGHHIIAEPDPYVRPAFFATYL